MKISIENLDAIRALMGSEASIEEAKRMIALCRREDIEDTDDVKDHHWFRLVAECETATPEEGESLAHVLDDEAEESGEVERTTVQARGPVECQERRLALLWQRFQALPHDNDAASGILCHLFGALEVMVRPAWPNGFTPAEVVSALERAIASEEEWRRERMERDAARKEGGV